MACLWREVPIERLGLGQVWITLILVKQLGHRLFISNPANGFTDQGRGADDPDLGRGADRV